jgi:ADP-ribosylation factor-like protein 1
VETISFKNIKLQVWDLGGQTNIRPYWRCYFPGTNAIIFVVDSTDTDRLDIAKKELSSLLEEEELATVALLVFANKQDAAGALSAAAISEALGLQSIKTHSWFICRAVATTGEGLHEGLDWLVNQINSSK